MKSNEEMLEALKGLVQIESIAGMDASPEAPYGAGPAAALKYVIKLCDGLGMRTADRMGKVGWAEIGEGSEIVGILAHLDVVPAGSGWSVPPYDLTEKDGKIYGRGVSDDKGPLIASVYAMKDILDSGMELKRRVRIIFGQSEETGIWDDMDWYREHEELPAFGFTPDADFPAIYGEKGLICMELSLPLEKSLLDDIEGGNASNVVPPWCRASVGGKTYETSGRAAHASTPEDGESAVTAMMEMLDKVIPDDPLVGFYRTYIGSAINGERMGCANKDPESGLLTMNAGTIRVRDGMILMELDVRNPVTYPAESVLEPVRKAAEAFGLGMRVKENTPPVYMDRDGKVIQTLVEVYRSVTGDCTEPAVIGGGTYAKAMDNIVAFGPMRPGRELTEHMADEYMLRQDLLDIRTIYRLAIEKLAQL